MADPLTLCDVLEDEYDALHGPPAGGHDKTKPGTERLDAVFGKIHQAGRTALCISGGGIRSATFALGVVQGLARHGLLDKFHYLSTVSGGGYVGSWLNAWIYRHPQGVEGVCEQLKAAPISKLQPEPAPIRYLRAYSNYLTPRLGLLSADTWTLVAIYLRNLILNWLVLIPALLAVLALPRLAASAILAEVAPWVLWGSLVAGGVLAVAGLVYIGTHRPSARRQGPPEATKPGAKDDRDDPGGEQGRFLIWCLLPLAAAAALLISFWAWRARSGVTPQIDRFTAFGLALHLLSWAIYATRWRRWQVNELGVVVTTGAFGGLLAWVAAAKAFPQPSVHPLLYACLAVPLFLILLLLAGTAFVGIGSRIMTDEDREWAARFGAWVLIVATVWAVGSLLVILGPVWLSELKTWVASLGGLAGAITVFLGGSAKSGSAANGRPASLPAALVQFLPRLAAPVFLVSLVIALAWSTDWLLLGLEGAMRMLPASRAGLIAAAPSAERTDFLHAAVVLGTGAPRVLAFATLMALFAWVTSWFVNVNKFSLHAMYRNRLIRAYLGASREKGERHPDGFTGFDPEDNLRMKRLWGVSAAKADRRKLFHVVNCTLNLVKGENLAWQERKAESFTVSPLHCGSFHLQGGGYRPSSHYGGSDPHDPGISLGTAVTISGAAASPNMGYHSSPLVTFLMALFNARLGWWLGNPGKAGAGTWHLSHPTLALVPIVSEALGLTDDSHPYVYLSDGGHFENLALYEMVLRRCHAIVVSDAGCDPLYTFEDLGNAIRKIRIDLGVPIRVEHLTFGTGTVASVKGVCCAVGSIDYAEVDGEGTPPGVLIYLKPGLTGDEPADVRSYAHARALFPHEPTSDQWFTESQFESYRALGSYVMDEICKSGAPTVDAMAAGIRAVTVPATRPLGSGGPPAGGGPAIAMGNV